MENRTVKTKNLPDSENRFTDTTLQLFDLPCLVDNMKRNESWAKGELNAMILLKKADRQIVLATLHKGTKIKSFRSEDLTTLQIIEGNLKIQNRKESVVLNKGQLLTLHENTKCSLTTKVQTVFLITIARDNCQSVNSIYAG